MNLRRGGHASASNNSRFSRLSDGGGSRELGFEGPAVIVSVIHVTSRAQLPDARHTQVPSSLRRDGLVQSTLGFLSPLSPSLRGPFSPRRIAQMTRVGKAQGHVNELKGPRGFSPSLLPQVMPSTEVGM